MSLPSSLVIARVGHIDRGVSDQGFCMSSSFCDEPIIAIESNTPLITSCWVEG